MASGWWIYPARNTEKGGRRGRKKNQSINELIRAAFRVVRWVSEGKKRITTVIVNTLVCVCLFIDHFGKLNIQGHRSMDGVKGILIILRCYFPISPPSLEMIH